MAALLVLHFLLAPQLFDPPKESISAKKDRLIAEIVKHRTAGKHADAVKPAEEFVSIAKQDGRAEFGLAGLLARAGKTDDAFKHLDRAIKLHGVLPPLLDAGGDFDSIRKDARFDKARDDAANEFIAAQNKAKSSWTVTLPKEYDPWTAAPLIVALHGFGGDRRHMIGMWSALANEYGAILVTPEGQINADGGGKSWGGRGAAERVVLSVNGDTRRRLRIDSTRTVLTGFSQGGAMTWGFVLSNPHTFRCAMPMAGPFSWRSDPKFKTDELAGLRLFIYVGGADRADIVSTNDFAARQFATAGCEVRFFSAPGVGHALPPAPGKLLHEMLDFAFAAQPKPQPVKGPTTRRAAP